MSHTLFELNEFIRRVIALNLSEALWIRAELADVKVSKGHCYLDLVQKGEAGDVIVAQGQAVIWLKNYRQLHKKLGQTFEALLQQGMEILFLAKPEFHERFGLKLILEDIDPSHTLGQLEMQRQETIRKLQSLNLLQKNGQLPMPPVLQRIAVLSSERAAGFQDFSQHLATNSFGYRFKLTLFQVAVQGALVEQEVAAQLETIAKRRHEFDAVAVIRGGGARLDLAAFDSFLLAKKVADLPLPVLTGIGHDVDETVLDLVAHTSLKTPTAVADFILHRNLAYESQVMSLGMEARSLVHRTLKEKASVLQYTSQLIDFQLKASFRRQAQMLEYIEKELPMTLKTQFTKARLQLEHVEKTIRLLGPDTAMKRGFALVFQHGKQVLDAADLAPGDEVQIQLKKGGFHATVKQTDQ